MASLLPLAAKLWSVENRRLHRRAFNGSKFYYDLTKAGAADLTGQLEIKSVNRVAKATVSLKKQP